MLWSVWFLKLGLRMWTWGLEKAFGHRDVYVKWSPETDELV